MIPLKTAFLGATLALAATPLLADASMNDVISAQDTVLSAKMDADAKSHVFNITIGGFGVVDTALGAHDADYEVVLADRGIAVGAALYGQHDASADAWLTAANFFDTAALGRNDADYETALKDRGIAVGAALYGQYDGDYDAVLFPQSAGCHTGAACF
ncbi:MAG: hypothetical protein ABJF50_12255 [Paracoccaceae bacterium]